MLQGNAEHDNCSCVWPCSSGTHGECGQAKEGLCRPQLEGELRTVGPWLIARLVGGV